MGLMFLSQDIRTRLNTYCTVRIKDEYDVEMLMISESIQSNEMRFGYKSLSSLIDTETSFSSPIDIY
jgi:hypothetical protein